MWNNFSQISTRFGKLLFKGFIPLDSHLDPQCIVMIVRLVMSGSYFVKQLRLILHSTVLDQNLGIETLQDDFIFMTEIKEGLRVRFQMRCNHSQVLCNMKKENDKKRE